MTRPAFIAELLEAAEKATPGDWHVDPDDRDSMEWNNHIIDDNGGRICFMANDGTKENIIGQANANHIALSCPAKTCELARYIEELEAGREAAYDTAFNDAKVLDASNAAHIVRLEAEVKERREALNELKAWIAQGGNRAAELGEKP